MPAASVKAQLLKALSKRLQAPHVPSARLRGDLQNTYKIKLRDVGYRLVYEVTLDAVLGIRTTRSQ